MTHSPPPHKHQSERVLAIKLGAFGDIVLADGALRDIRAHHADARIHVLTRRAFAKLFERCPWVDAIHIDENAPRWRIAAMLRWRRWFAQAGYTRVYDLQNSRRTEFYRRWLSGAGASVPIWSFSDHRSKYGDGLDVPEQHARQLEAAGIAANCSRMPRPAWIADDASELLREAGVASPFVLLLPGSSARHPEKRWPHFLALSQALTARGIHVVTVPGPDEADLGAGFAGHVLRRAAAGGTRCLNLHELAGVARAAACVVGNDSGPTHLAACLDAPCVVLFDGDNRSVGRIGLQRRNAISLIVKPLGALMVQNVIDAVIEQCAGESRHRPAQAY